MVMRSWALALAILGAVLGSALPAAAQGYPGKPITLIVPWPAGGGIDVPGRIVADLAARRWKVPVNVVNKPGASGATGVIEALGAAPDGYTLLIDSGATSSLQSIAVKDLPYRFEDRAYVARALTLPMNLFVRADSTYRSLADLRDAVRKNPGGFVWGTAPPSTVTAVALDQMFQAFGVPVRATKRVVFRGGPEVAQAVAGGHVEVSSIAVAGTMPLISAGKLRAVAVLMPERVAMLPDVPTSREQGFATIDATAWIGVSGPKGLPDEVTRKWQSLLEEASRDPAFTEAALKVGAVPFYAAEGPYRAFVLAERDAAAKAAQE